MEYKHYYCVYFSNTRSISRAAMHTLYHNAFNTKIKTKPFEQFSILMFDLEKEVSTKNQQKNLLDQILFGDQNSAQSWADYISYVMDIFPGQKMQIQRLINKGISCVDENKYRESKHLLKLHLNCASLKR